MNTLESERKNNRVLYRKIFFEADKAFKQQLLKLKSDFKCAECRKCCELRYSNLSPSQIYELSLQGDETSQEFMTLFIPYGEEKTFDYAQNAEISPQKNIEAAFKFNKNYVLKVLNNCGQEVYFYFCRNFAEKNCACTKKLSLCEEFPANANTILPDGCSFKDWQKLCIDTIESEISKDVSKKIFDIQDYGKSFSCNRCATCCNLACSEFSYEELKQKASSGDNFAKQFTSVFIPYESIAEARKIFPEYVELVEKTMDIDEKIYFYHCPHLSTENLCTNYENRPEICRDFPDNPLSILPPTCGFCKWKDEVMPDAMTLHAMTYIYNFYLEKIKQAV